MCTRFKKNLVSEHFRIHYHPGDENQATWVKGILESAYSPVSEYLGYDLPPMDTYIPLSKEEYTNLTTLLADGSGGTYSFGNLYFNRPTVESCDQVVIIHEFVHAVQNMGYTARGGGQGDPPNWISEGTATYVSHKILGSLPQLSVLLTAPSDKLLTLDDIAEHQTTSPWNNSPAVRRLSYEESIGVFLYIEYRWGEPGVAKLLQKITELGNWRTAFQESLGIPYERFQDEWLQSLKDATMRKKVFGRFAFAYGIFRIGKRAHIVAFKSPSANCQVNRISVFGSLQGKGSDISITIYDSDFEKLYISPRTDASRHFVTVEKWVDFSIPNVKVPSKYYVAVDTHSTPDNGVNIGYNMIEEGDEPRSYIGTDRIQDWNLSFDRTRFNWMIRSQVRGENEYSDLGG